MTRTRLWMVAVALGVAIALLACCVAMAATGWVDIEQRLSPAQLHATGLDTLKAEQLALLNRLLREDDAARADAAARAPVARPVGDAPAAGADTTAPPPAREPLFGFNDGPIVTRLVGTLSGWEPGTEFTFANGQRWEGAQGPLHLAQAARFARGEAGAWRGGSLVHPHRRRHPRCAGVPHRLSTRAAPTRAP